MKRVVEEVIDVIRAQKGWESANTEVGSYNIKRSMSHGVGVLNMHMHMLHVCMFKVHVI